MFVLSSLHEGLPNALLEAAAGGLPIVTTRASAGLVELVNGREGVWLAGETSADGIAHAMTQALRAANPQQRFAHPWVNAFRMDEAVAQYEALIEEQLAGAPR